MADPSVTIVDLVVGTGEEAVANKLITVRYTSEVQGTPNRPIAAPLAPGETIEVPLPGDMLIAGWNDGVLGMKVGGKRRITIPPELAYRNLGVGDIVPVDATLIFEVELVSLRAIPS